MLCSFFPAYHLERILLSWCCCWFHSFLFYCCQVGSNFSCWQNQAPQHCCCPCPMTSYSPRFSDPLEGCFVKDSSQLEIILVLTRRQGMTPLLPSSWSFHLIFGGGPHGAGESQETKSLRRKCLIPSRSRRPWTLQLVRWGERVCVRVSHWVRYRVFVWFVVEFWETTGNQVMLPRDARRGCWRCCRYWWGSVCKNQNAKLILNTNTTSSAHKILLHRMLGSCIWCYSEKQISNEIV